MQEQIVKQVIIDKTLYTITAMPVGKEWDYRLSRDGRMVANGRKYATSQHAIQAGMQQAVIHWGRVKA